MKTHKLKMILLVVSICVLALIGIAFGAGFASQSDCLVTNDIGKYSFESQSARIGNGSGVIGMMGHFSKDHTDTVCSGEYSNINEIKGLSINDARNAIIGITVQVTKHAGSDSDKWLLHEVEKGFQKSKQLGSIYVSPNPLRDINGNKIFYTWGYYRWISNYVVVSIQFTDMTGTKSEPLEVVQAYLQKFPSTIPTTIVLDNAHKVQWIKDEMDRRLWLCDKWFMQLQLKKVDEKQVYQESVKSMNIFLDYREKYYGIKAADEKNLLAGYLNTNNGTGIKAKLTEYKNWWTANKSSAINL